MIIPSNLRLSIYNRLTIVLGIIALISRDEYSRGGGKGVHLLYPLIRIKEKLERIFIFYSVCLYIEKNLRLIRKMGREEEEERGRK